MKGKTNLKKGAILSAALFSVLLLSVFSSNVSAVHGRIWPATIILRPSVMIYEATTATSQFEITNLDSKQAEVNIAPNNNLNDYVDINTPYVFLEPGQSEIITFDIVVSDALQHTGDIFVTFSEPAISYTYFVDLSIYPTSGGYAANTHAPDAPTDLTPRDDYCGRDVTVSWTAASDDDGNNIVYEFTLDNNNDFSSKIDDGIVVGTEKTFHLEPGLYFWRIRSYDGRYTSQWVTSSFKINEPLECGSKIDELENRIENLENRFDPLEALVNAIRSAVCSLGDFSFCSGGPTECAGTDTECGLGGVCQNCNMLDSCYSGYYRDYYCSSQACSYTSSCTEACCDLQYGDPAAYCSSGVCNAPVGGCVDACTAGDTRCSGDYIQTCADYDPDECVEWGGDQLCDNGCFNGECAELCIESGNECQADGDCCSDSCVNVRVCVSYNFHGVCSRYVYQWECQ